MIFEQMIAQRPNITVLKSHVLSAVESAPAAKTTVDAVSTTAGDAAERSAPRRISRLTFTGVGDHVGERVTFEPAVCIGCGTRG